MWKAVPISGLIAALARVDRSASAFSASPRSVSASARMRPASFLGAWTSTRTKPRAAARRRCVRVALRWDLLAIDPSQAVEFRFRLYNRKYDEIQSGSFLE